MISLENAARRSKKFAARIREQMLDVRQIAEAEYEIDRPVTEGFVGDVSVAMSRIPEFR